MKWLSVATWGDAQKQVQKAGQIAWGTTNTDLPTMAGRVVNVLLSILGLVFLIQGLYAGYKWMMAQGNNKDVEYAKQTIKNNIVGVIIVALAFALTNFVV